MAFYIPHSQKPEEYQDSAILKNPIAETQCNSASFVNAPNYQYVQPSSYGYYANPSFQAHPEIQTREPQHLPAQNEASLLEMYKNSLSYMVQELATTWTNSPGDPIFLHHLFRIQMSQSLADLHPYISLFGPCFESLSSSSWLISLSQYLIIKLNSLYLCDTNETSNGGEMMNNPTYIDENNRYGQHITPPPRPNSFETYLTPSVQYVDADVNSKSSTQSSAITISSSFQNHPLYQSYDNSYTSSHLSENTEYYTDSTHTPNSTNYKEMLWKFGKSKGYSSSYSCSPENLRPEKTHITTGNKYLINSADNVKMPVNNTIANCSAFEQQVYIPQDNVNEYATTAQGPYNAPNKQPVPNALYTSPKTRGKVSSRSSQSSRTVNKAIPKASTNNGEIVMLSDYAQPMKGVSFNAKKQAWLAYWTMMNNFQMRKFPIKKHGFKNAKQLAIQCRLEAERQNSNERLERAKEKMALQGNGF